MRVGAPATGPDFWGREKDLAAIWRYLEKEHLVFPGVRRLGKSSILLKLQDEASTHGAIGRWVDVSGIHHASDFVALLDREFPVAGIKAFLKSNATAATDWLGRIQKVKLTTPKEIGGAGVEIDLHSKSAVTWDAQALQVQQRLQDQPLLILLDEFPVMLQNILGRNAAEAASLLVWLRTWRQTAGNTCRFVFTGSIGLQSLLEQHQLAAHMNDCYPYPLGPFSASQAQGMWQHFAQEAGWDSKASLAQHALDRIGWLSPFFICLLLDESVKAARIRIEETPAPPPANGSGSPLTPLTKEDSDNAFENLLAQRSRFHHWEQRLQKSLSVSDFKFCQTLLTHLSKAKDGLTLKQLSNRLAKLQADASLREDHLLSALARLTDEGYTSPVNAAQRVHFRSFLLREWWRRNHV